LKIERKIIDLIIYNKMFQTFAPYCIPMGRSWDVCPKVEP